MSKAARERSARERLAEQRAREAAKEKRTRNLTVVASAVAVLVVVVVIGVIIANKKQGTPKGEYAGPYAPVSKQADGTYVMAQPNVTGPVVDLYEDLQCPRCKEFEAANGADVERLAYQGKAKVVYHVLSFVNPSGSVRAAVAAGCAADAGKFVEFHNVAYRKQPDETQALTVSDLKGFGKDVGITSPTFDTCVAKQAGADKERQFTQTASEYLTKKVGQAGTPTVFINNKVINGGLFTNGGLAPQITAIPPTTSGPSAAPSASPSGSASSSPKASTSPSAGK